MTRTRHHRPRNGDAQVSNVERARLAVPSSSATRTSTTAQSAIRNPPHSWRSAPRADRIPQGTCAPRAIRPSSSAKASRRRQPCTCTKPPYSSTRCFKSIHIRCTVAMRQGLPQRRAPVIALTMPSSWQNGLTFARQRSHRSSRFSMVPRFLFNRHFLRS